MKQPKRPTKKSMADLEANNYITTVNDISKNSLLPVKDKYASLDASPSTYSGEYSPAPLMRGASDARRVDFGENPFNERLGDGMSPYTNPDDIYTNNQGGFETFGKILGRSSSGAVMKFAEGVASLGSLIGEGGLSIADTILGGSLEKIGYDGSFDWDDATENPIVSGLGKAEEWMNENLFKVYKPTNWNDKSFAEQVMDGAWWGNEGADGIAFALSNFIPAGILGKAGLGTKALVGLADLGEMNAATRFLTAGRAGLLRAEGLGNLADRAVSTAFMTTSESVFEAKDTGETFSRMYLDKYNQANGTQFKDAKELEQVDPNAFEDMKTKKGDAMKHTFFANMAALTASNWIEAGLLSRMMGKGTKSALSAEVNLGEEFLDPVTRVQRKGLDKFFNGTRAGYTLKTVGEQMVTEGLYEENIQSAIQNASQNLALNGKIDNIKYIEDITKGMWDNVFDKEGQKSIGAGMIIGGLFGGVGAQSSFSNKEKEANDAVIKLNELSDNTRKVGQIYNSEGKVDTAKLENYLANLVQVKNIQEIHDYYKGKGENELADIVKNEAIATYVKGFMEVGLGEDLNLKIKDLQKVTEGDLTNWGFDPLDFNTDEDGVLGSQQRVQQRFKELEDKVKDYSNEYKNIERIVPPTQRARQGEALSWYARYKHLTSLKNKLDRKLSFMGVDAIAQDNSPAVAINSLIDEYNAIVSELPNQEKYSLPKRVAQTREKLTLLEKEISLAKQASAEQLGDKLTQGLEKIETEVPINQKDLDNTKRTIVQVENAIADAKDNYDGITDINGGEAFYEGLRNKALEIADETEVEDGFVEGDYIEVTNPNGETKSGFVSANENGRLMFGNVIIDENFAKNNQVTKLTEEQVQGLKNQNVEDYRKSSIRKKIDTLRNSLNTINERIGKGNDYLTEQVITKEEIVLNTEKGIVRLSERQLAKQLKQIEKNLQEGEELLTTLEEQRELIQNEITEYQYLYDTEETIDDVKDLIEKAEQDIVEVEAQIAEVNPIVERLKSVYFSMLNMWKSLFPSKEYKSLEERALEIEDAIERGVDPQVYAEEAKSIVNKLSDYTDYKQDLQLTGAEMRIVQRDLDELESIRTVLYNNLNQLNEKLKEYELQEKKLEYVKVLRPETGQKEQAGNKVTKGKTEKTNFNDLSRDVKNVVNSTVGNHLNKEGNGLTTDESQLRWYKFTEEYDTVKGKNRLRIISLNDTDYGIGSENNIYKNDAKEYQRDNHFKALVVYEDGTPIRRNGELVFTSLPEPKEDYSKFRNDSGLTEDAIEELDKDYRKLLERSKSEPVYVDINGKSNGVVRKNTENISIKKAFGTEDIDIDVILTGSTLVNKKSFPLYEGLVYANYKGRPVGLINRTVTQEEAEAVVAKLKEYSVVRGNKEEVKGVSPQSILNQITSTIFLGERKFNPQYNIFFLKGENKLVFGDNIITHEELQSGKYDVQLEQFLSDINHHVKESTLKDKKEYKDIFGKVWNSYKEYLISERENTPLMSDLRPYSDSINEPQFVNTYLTFDSGTKKKAKVKESTGKGSKTKENFASNLDFTVVPSNTSLRSEIGAEKVEAKIQNKVDKAIDNELERDFDSVKIPDHVNFPSVESFFNNDETEEVVKEEPKIKPEEVAQIKADKGPSLEDILADTVFEEEVTPRTDIGSDDLFDTKLSIPGLKDKNLGYYETYNSKEAYEDSQRYDEEKDKQEKPFKDWEVIDSNGKTIEWFDTEEQAIAFKDKNNAMVDKKIYEQGIANEESYARQKKWFRENVSSTAPYERVQGLVDGRAWGMFYNNAEILISNFAEKGTGYHEAFHYVSALGLTAEEQDALYDEWFKNNKDILAVKNTHPERFEYLSDEGVAEEKLADAFAEYMLTNESEYKTWFSKLVDFIKEIFKINSNTPLKDELFKKIKEGAFKDKPHIVKSSKYIKRYSIPNPINATTKKNIMDGLTTVLFANLYKSGFDINDIRAFNSDVLGEEKTKEFKDIYRNTYDRVINDIRNYAPNQVNTNFTKKQLITILESPDTKADMISNHINYLKNVGLQFSLENDTDINNLAEDEKGRDTLGIVDAIEFSTKNSMPNEIKLLITSLPQYEIINGEYKVKRNELGLTIPTDYRRNVAILHNALAGISSFEEQMNTILNLVPKIPELKALYNKLNTGDNTTREGLYVQAKFRQQFDKNKYTFLLQLYDGNNSYIIDSNNSRLSEIIKANWEGSLVRNKKAITVKDGVQYLNKDYFAKYSKLNNNDIEQDILDFYKDLGIIFSNPKELNYDKLYNKSMVHIVKDIQDDTITTDIYSDANDISGYLNLALEEEIRTSLDYSDNQHINPQGKTVYNISLNDYNSLIVNEINRQGLPEHLTWNEETQKGNPLVRHSLWINKIKNKSKIETIILEGARRDEIGEEGKLTSNLNRGEAAIQQFTAIMGGFLKGSKSYFPFLRAGDKSLEKGFTFNEQLRELSFQEANETFRGYLSDEMLSAYMLNVEGVGEDIQYYNKFGKGLRIFEGVLNAKDLKDATKIMTTGRNRKSAISSIDTFVERPTVIKAIEQYLEQKTQDNIDELIKSKVLEKTDKGYSNIGLPSEILERFVENDNSISKGEMNNLMGQFTYNSLIANIEQTKIFTGDIAYFKDFFKRTSGLVGTGKTAWVGSYIDKLLNSLFPRTDKKSDSLLKTWVFNDVISASTAYNDLVKAYVDYGFKEKEAKEILKSYLENNEADAQGYITLPEYREFNIRLGDWNQDREEVYRKAINEEKLTKKDFMLLNPEKPQAYAPQQYDEAYVPTFYKLSVVPLIPSMIKGRTLEKLNQAMLDNGIGISVFESGNKVGAKNVRPFYNSKGEFNTDNTEPSHILQYQYMKKQLDINPEQKDKVVFGTQFRKLILSGLIGKMLTIKGKSVNGTDIIKKFNGLIDNQVKKELNKLLKELDIEQVSSDEFKIKNVNAIKNILKEESLRRSAPDNLIESLDSIFKQGDVKPVEISVNRNKIEQILMSLINNNVIKQKVRGGSLVQVASTGFESTPRKQSDVAKETWASNLDTLKFYQPTENGTTAMQVYLPFKFKEVFGSVKGQDIDARLKQLIAFRIPTQGLNSIEAIDVKGFLPQEAGDIIVVPTEGVTKSGWDFDVDKLNVFYPNYTYNKADNKFEYVEDDEHNQIIQLSRDILLAKENFVPLTTPNTTQDLLNMEKEITSLNPELGRSENERSKFVDWAYNLAVRQTYLIGKTGVGQAALQNVNHVMGQIAGLKMKVESPIYLNAHIQEDVVDLSQEKDTNNSPTTILDIISQALNGFVDIAKEPFLKTLNVTPETSNTFFYLIRAGVPLRQTALFLNQPSIREYLDALETRKTLYGEETFSKQDVAQSVLDAWDSTDEVNLDNEGALYKKDITENKLASYIKDKAKEKAIQRQLLQDYLVYSAQADTLSNLIQAVNFDTSTAPSVEQARTKVEDFMQLIKDDTFINAKKLLSETFLGSFAKATEDSINIYKNLFITESNSQIRGAIDTIKRIIKTPFVKSDSLDKIMSLVKNDIVSYLIQNAKIGGNRFGNNINSYFIDKTTNLPSKLAIIKEKHEVLKDNYLVRELIPLLSKSNNKTGINSKDVNNIKMLTKRMSAQEQNLVTDGWRELFEHSDPTVIDFAWDLAQFAILQSGINNSPLSFTQFIPNEIYTLLSSKLIDNSLNNNFKSDDFVSKFFKNNYRNKDIVATQKVYDNTKNDDGTVNSKRTSPFLKLWDKKKKDFKLFQNTYEVNGKYNIFEETNRLGDNFNFKEYASTTSALASNNIGALPFTLTAEQEKRFDTRNKIIKAVKDLGLNEATEKAYIERINKSKDKAEIADILKDLCS